MKVSDVKIKFGKCLELVSMDPNFHNISVGLFIKKDVLTVWSYSKKEGVESRLNQIRDKMIEFGGLSHLDEDFKMTVPKGALIERPLKFLFSQCVEMSPDKKLKQWHPYSSSRGCGAELEVVGIFPYYYRSPRPNLCLENRHPIPSRCGIRREVWYSAVRLGQ